MEPRSLLHTQLPFVTCQQKQTEDSYHNFKCKHKQDKKLLWKQGTKTFRENLQMLQVPTFSLVVKWKNLKCDTLSMNVFDNVHRRRLNLTGLREKLIKYQLDIDRLKGPLSTFISQS